MSNINYTKEVLDQCCVCKGCDHGPAPIPEEGKWVQAKEIKDISGLTHGVGWCAPQQGACKLTLNIKNGVIEEAVGVCLRIRHVNGDSDRFRAAARKAAGNVIGDVFEPLHGLIDPTARGFGDRSGLIQYTGHRRRGHPCGFRHILDRYGHILLHATVCINHFIKNKTFSFFHPVFIIHDKTG